MPGETPSKKNNATMKTIDKAMSLLDFFVPHSPEWGLSDLARAAGMDKVTAMRILNSLAAKGITEQHAQTRKYRLGTAVLRLARIRETSFPLTSLLQPILEELSEKVGETSHASLPHGESLTTIAIAEPNRATRVSLEPAQVLPLHATASGQVYLANLDNAVFPGVFGRLDLRPFTANTIVDPVQLKAQLHKIQKEGHVIANGAYEVDVLGIAAPFFDWQGKVMGTIAAACVASRITDETARHIVECVQDAAIKATRATGGDMPKNPPAMLKENPT